MNKPRKQRVKLFEEEAIMAFAARLKAVRKERGFTQDQLAFTSGLALSQIARIETGRINPTLSTIIALSRALEIEPAELFTS